MFSQNAPVWLVGVVLEVRFLIESYLESSRVSMMELKAGCYFFKKKAPYASEIVNTYHL